MCMTHIATVDTTELWSILPFVLGVKAQEPAYFLDMDRLSRPKEHQPQEPSNLRSNGSNYGLPFPPQQLFMA